MICNICCVETKGKTLNQLIIDVFQALDDTERGEGGFGSTGKNWKLFEYAFLLLFCYF